MSEHRSELIFKEREFLFFISGRFCFTIAILMQSVVIGWQVYEFTKDALSLGMIGLAEAVPAIITAMIAGAIVDSRDRKKVLMFAYLLMFISSVLLFVLSSDVISFNLNNKLILIYTIVFVTGVSRGFYMPAAQALLGQVIKKDLYAYAVSWNTSIWQIGAISGPAIGGFIYGFMGVKITYLTITLLILAAIIFINFISPKPVNSEYSAGLSIKEKLTAGLRFVLGKKIILGSMSLDLFAVLFGGATALLPIFASDILLVGPEGLGILRAAPSIGAVIMALYLTKNPPLKNTGKKLYINVALFGLCMLGFAISRNLWLSVIFLALSGMFDSVSVIIRQTILQLYTPDEMKGRVAAVNSIFIGSSNEIGAFESGLAAKLLGVIPSVVFGSIMTLAVVICFIFIFPELRRMQFEKNK